LRLSARHYRYNWNTYVLYPFPCTGITSFVFPSSNPTGWLLWYLFLPPIREHCDRDEFDRFGVTGGHNKLCLFFVHLAAVASSSDAMRLLYYYYYYPQPIRKHRDRYELNRFGDGHDNKLCLFWFTWRLTTPVRLTKNIVMRYIKCAPASMRSPASLSKTMKLHRDCCCKPRFCVTHRQRACSQVGYNIIYICTCIT